MLEATVDLYWAAGVVVGIGRSHLGVGTQLVEDSWGFDPILCGFPGHNKGR